jgi:hypothetical protein
MVKLKYLFSAWIGLVLVSCIPPKAAVVAEPPVKKKEEKQPEPAATETPLPTLPDDGLRIGNMLELPSDGEFRPTSPAASKVGTDAGAVISRPPTDPPSRVKPKEDPPKDQR